MTADATNPKRWLFVRDVAAMHGVSLATARGWLAALEREHGDEVVGRRGNRLCTTAAALAAFTPGRLVQPRPQHALETRVGRMDKRLRLVEQKQELILERLNAEASA